MTSLLTHVLNSSLSMMTPDLLKPLSAGMPLEVLPHIKDIMAIMTVGLVVLIPVTGFSIRFAIRPVIDQLVRLRDGDAHHRGLSQLDHRVLALEQRIQVLEGQLARLNAGAPALTAGGNSAPMSRQVPHTGMLMGNGGGAGMRPELGQPVPMVAVPTRLTGDPTRDALDAELGRLGMQAAHGGQV